MSVVSFQTVSLGFSIGLAGGLMGMQTSFSRSGGGVGGLGFYISNKLPSHLDAVGSRPHLERQV